MAKNENDKQGDILWQNDRLEIRKVPSSQNNPTLHLRMIGELNIYTVNKIKDFFVAQAKEFAAIKVDLAGIQEFDTAGFQFLLALKAEALLQKHSLHFHGHPAQIMEYLDILGAVGLMGDKVVLPKEQKSNYSFKYGLKKQNFVYLQQ